MQKTTLTAAIGMALLSACTSQTQTSSTTEAANKPSHDVQTTSLASPELIDNIFKADNYPADVDAVASEPLDDALLMRIRKGFQFTHDYSNPRFNSQVKWYASHQSYFDTVLKRSSPYLYHIVAELEANQLPTELALLPIVESAYDPFAYSQSHAAGLWQFMPATGKHFGLERNQWYEGRRDIVASTAAAIKYLSYLNKRFKGDWLLSLAAYNSGEGTVGRAITKNKKAGKATDFWSLQLPKETRAYVPQLLAIATIFNEPQRHGVTLASIPDEPYFEQINCGSQLDLAQAAAMADISVKEVHRLNPAYNRWTTPPGSKHVILMPTYCADKFKTTLAATPPQQWVANREYRVKSGDNLGAIALKNKISVANLRQQNNLNNNLIRTGQILKIPGGGDYNQIGTTKNSFYEVRHGDSLWKIANTNKVSVNDLLAWNNLSTKDIIQPGQQLQIPKKKPIQTTRKMHYKVKRGDSLALIANQFNLLIKDIAKWNQLSISKYLQPGQKLTLYIDI